MSDGRAAALDAEAKALRAAYRRGCWIRFTLVIFPVPFVVALLRLQFDAWHYVLAGGAYLGFSMLLFVIDGRASDRCAAAEKSAEAAHRAAATEGR